MSKKIAVIAIGGNSLIKDAAHQTVEDQYEAAKATCLHIADMIEAGYEVIIGHGNGPQVGFIMRRSEVARRLTGLHPVPLVNIVADTQGSIGYQIQQSLNNELARRSVKGQCVTVVTQVMVDGNDPGFRKPSKPVGEFFDDQQVGAIRQDNPDWTLVQDAGRGWRRVVPSPEPREVVEKQVVVTLLQSGCHVVTVGGGGIPVVKTEHGLEGVDAVIDKDLASSLLAHQLDVGLFIISTEVEEVALNFGKPNQRPIKQMTVREAEQYVVEGHFAPGSMLPKIEAALRFLRGGGREVIITSPERLKEAVVSGRGTHIVP